MKKLVLGTLLVAGLVSHVQALSITPTTGTLNVTRWQGTQHENPSVTDVQNTTGVTGLSIDYKQNVNGSEEGPLAGSYTTTFSNSSSNPSDALIDYISGTSITGDHIFLLVKDGNHSPWWYLFDISGWNGTEDLRLSGFWPGGGSISHVTILSDSRTSVPEGGATIVMLGLACCALAAGYRRAKK